MNEDKYKKELEVKKKAMQSLIKSQTDGLVDGKALWANPELNDNNWNVMNLPGPWELGPLPDVDGIVWYRKTIELTQAQIAKGAVLYLGMIDDSDKSWVNGNFVG